MEKYGLQIEDLRLLGVLENLFTYEGRAGHEVVFVFVGRAAEAAAYGVAELAAVEAGGRRREAAWVSVRELEGGEVPLYTGGLLELCEVLDELHVHLRRS